MRFREYLHTAVKFTLDVTECYYPLLQWIGTAFTLSMSLFLLIVL